MTPMKYFHAYILLIFSFLVLDQSKASAQVEDLYDDSQVASIYIQIDPDTLQYIIDYKINDTYFRCWMRYQSASRNDTIENVGIRLKGNTSLSNFKKSFKISFNEFKKGKKFQDVKKLNLLACVNDPTTIRQKLYYEIWGQSGIYSRRSAFVKLYINGEYRGLYTNLEEQDDQWVEGNFSADTGNLYKCTWPASLEYLGDDQDVYKSILNDPETRAYDLKTNEDADDYSHLVELMKVLDDPDAPDFSTKVSQILNVEQVLKAYAIDILTGNWDDYFYLQNNYYLYDNPATGRFEYFAYDTDNSFGIDWLGIDWLRRPYKNWFHHADPRPLITALLSVPEFESSFIEFLKNINNTVYTEENLFPIIDKWKNLITTFVNVDTYYPLDFGYTPQSFQKSFTEQVVAHEPHGLKPFISNRHLIIKNALVKNKYVFSSIEPLKLYPNPTTEVINVEWTSFEKADEIEILDLNGQRVKNIYGESLSQQKIDCSDWIPGLYNIRVYKNGKVYQNQVFKF